MMTCARSVALASSLLLACVGDSTVTGPDASSGTDGGDGGDATTDAGVDAADASDAATNGDGEAGCGTQPFAKLNANCAQTSCLHATQTTCVQNASTCETGGGKPLDCGSTSDCSSYACCLAATLTATPGCPNDVSVGGLTGAATVCSTNTSMACASNQIQVCVTSAECFTGTCQDTVFDFNGMKVVHFGTCR
jgi:hypothetical protein